jgi:hypothetical protein
MRAMASIWGAEATAWVCETIDLGCAVATADPVLPPCATIRSDPADNGNCNTFVSATAPAQTKSDKALATDITAL